ncbi:MAG TPA: bifunctional [glutamate--ammonia ligase]-adenylyl-L-tyrosine phosphorylase/[glutamate--ammonia-ligase] adenylyltransferase [Candidatus Acidoferrum sp.]|nr:bifunctional [glutamate--ammonia ligase]-adenylyl-L-tyrosine phosphorylase/[glutamate--ammonia-ligase] adenylyltransferase [Candidatus Acidoferrum sp.]
MQAATDLLLRTLQRFRETLESQPQLRGVFERHRSWQAELPELWLASDHAIELCMSRTALVADLVSEGDVAREYADWSAHLAAFRRRFLPAIAGDDHSLPTLQHVLRLFRQREWLRIVWRDVTRRATLQQTCNDLTALADACIRYALPPLQAQLVELHGKPLDARGAEQQLIVLAMGKYGAGELNLSSDIDLIFAFPEDGETRLDAAAAALHPLAQSCTVQHFFIRLGQQLVAALDTATPDGFVFRTDLRLRPYGSSGALALSIEALEEYYHSQGRDWERFAMIKVRAVTGAASAIGTLMAMLHGFTYRRYLDFATVESLRDLKRQIEQQVRRKGMLRNIKLGNGGIREIEFIVQVFQLIHGGRRPALQHAALQPALQSLQDAGLLSPEDAESLLHSYVFLRRLEHGIQALGDQQTHDYPDDALAEHRIALGLDCIDAQQLRRQLDTVRTQVARQFQELIKAGDTEQRERADLGLHQVWAGNVDSERSLTVLREQGYHEATEILRSMDSFKRSRQVLGLDRKSRERLDEFMPVLLTQVAKVPHSSQALLRVFTFVQAVVQRTIYLVLLMENPLALQQLVTLCAASPWAVELLSRYPVLLDELLRPLRQPPQLPELRSLLQRQLLRSAAGDVEGQLGVIQYFKQEQVLNVAAAELSGGMPLMKVSDYLSWIAESVVEQVLELAWRQLVTRHGHPVNADGASGSCAFIIIAYGKLGGLELNYGSDLDLVFVHDGHQELDTTGGNGQAINSSAFYVQLAQKILAYLGTQTLVGKLYEIDLRLRPSGASGALVSSLSAFERYQQQDAWTWEHQALVRARVIAGEQALAGKFNAVRSNVLARGRDVSVLRYDILDMRNRMQRQLGSRQLTQFDLKQDSGGLIDIEFMVQYLVLAHAHAHPAFLQYTDNMRLLDVAADNRVLAPATAAMLQRIYLEYRSELHKRALDLQESVLEGTAYAHERDEVRAAWQTLFTAGRTPA